MGWTGDAYDKCDEAGIKDDKACAQFIQKSGLAHVEPVGIHQVARHDTSLLILGSTQVAGHGGYPHFEAVVELPSAH